MKKSRVIIPSIIVMAALSFLILGEKTIMNKAQSIVAFKERFFPPSPIIMEDGQGFRFASGYISSVDTLPDSNKHAIKLELFLDDLSPLYFADDKEYMKRNAAKVTLKTYEPIDVSYLRSNDKISVMKAENTTDDLERYDTFDKTGSGMQDTPFMNTFIRRDQNTGEVRDVLSCNESNKKATVYKCIHNFTEDGLRYFYIGAFTKEELLQNWQYWREALVGFVKNAKITPPNTAQ